MPDVKDAEIIKIAAPVELSRARARIAELEAEAKVRTSTRSKAGQAFSYVLLACVGCVALAGAVALIRRLLLWGWS